MCSILGYFGNKQKLENIRNLNLGISHRGPDASDIKQYKFKNSTLFLAHNRLSIQDLSSLANQPMENERYSIVFNGEIYNHLEIRKFLNFQYFKSHGDTETLLYTFSEFGVEKTLSLLNGMFAIALFDKLDSKLYLMRDRVGKKPLYYTLQDDELAFASEPKGIPKYLKNKRDNKSLIKFVSLGYIPYDNTIFKSVKKLPAAHYGVFDGKNFEIFKYWDLPSKKIGISFDEAKKEAKKLLEESIKYRLISDLEVGCFLSGGVDSSLVSAMTQRLSPKNIKTFSIGFEDKRYDESSYAKEVANHIKSEHYEYRFRAKDVLDLLEDFDYCYDEPFGDASSLPMMLLAKKTREKVSVALSGDGGDELFLGYDRYFFVDKYLNLLQNNPALFRPLFSWIAKNSRYDKLEKMAHPIKFPTLENIYSILNTALKPWELRKVFQKNFLIETIGKNEASFFELQDYVLDGDDVIDALSRFDFRRYISDDICTKVDRATMRYALEARNPLLDYRLVEFAYSLPASVKLQNGSKGILKDILYGYIPKELIDRPKRGFSVPLKHWFRNELKGALLEKIETLDSAIFDKKEILKLVDLHINGNRNYEYIFWNLMRN